MLELVLNAILGFCQLMTRSQTLPPEHLENVGIVTPSGEHPLALINHVLYQFKIQSSKFKVQMVSGFMVLNLLHCFRELVLDLSKIEAGRAALNEKNFDLYRLLDRIFVPLQSR